VALKRRVAVAGFGSIGKRHVRLLLERDDVAVEVYEPDASTRAAAEAMFGGLTTHDSFDDLLDSAPDVVWLASPTHLHASQSIDALAAGAHVFCEKPMTYSVEEAKSVVAASQATCKVFNVGFHLRFCDALVTLKNLIDSGRLGRVIHLRAHVGTYITLVNSISRYQTRLPGSLFFDYSHQPDLFYWMLGCVPSAVSVWGGQVGELEFTSNPNFADLLCEYREPLVTHIHLNYLQMPQRHEYEVAGDKGWAHLDFEKGSLTVGYRETGATSLTAYVQERDDIFRAEHRTFFDAIDGKCSPMTPAAEGLVSTAVCEAALQSYFEKGKTTVRS
jgi:predicted dehydrogenase